MTLTRSFVLLLILSSFPLGSLSAAESPAQNPSDAAMEKIQMLMAPSDAHEVLKDYEGEWTYTGQFWMNPDAEPVQMTGELKSEVVFNGRFLKQEIEGPWMGEPFQGLGFTGYDNVKGEYVSVWLDNMSTGIMTASGSYDAGTKTLLLSGQNSCPMTGETNRFGRSEWTVLDADHTSYTSYAMDPAGNEYKTMEIIYTRK